MEILKDRKGRKASEFIDTRPDLPVYNLDTVAARFKAFSMMPSSFINEEGLSATEVFQRTLDQEVDKIINRYPCCFALNNPMFRGLLIKESTLVAWSKEALDIFIKTDYPVMMNVLKRYIEVELLKWANVDTSNMDRQQWDAEVDKALT
jgi:hypothetical protein